MRTFLDVKQRYRLQYKFYAFVVCLCLVSSLVGLCFFLLIDAWEVPYIVELAGYSGILLILILTVVLPSIVLWSFFNCQRYCCFVFCLIIVPIYLFYADWTISEFPHSLKLIGLDERCLLERNKHNIDGDLLLISSAKALFPNSDQRYLHAVLNRISLSNPSLIKSSTIKKLVSAKNENDAILLFYWLYLTSWYGEASAGRIPWFSKMTSETFRDFIQVHLPSIFIELRPFFLRLLSNISNRLNVGNEMLIKLKYLFHKSTYDVSMEPYDTQIFSDVLLVLLEYPQDFPELWSDKNSCGNSLNNIIYSNFKKIAYTCLQKPYERPYIHEKLSKKYYATHRKNIILFSRAIFYKFLTDFDFSTRIQMSIIKYYTEYYKSSLGESFWRSLSAYQKAVLIALLRDVYMPNIGKLSYNLYSLPELNCTPVNYIVQEVINDRSEVATGDYFKPWYPKDADSVIWGITGNKLKTLREIWSKLLCKHGRSINSAFNHHRYLRVQSGHGN